jgi:hypothetical protein
MLRINEHLISYFDIEFSRSAIRHLSLENTQGFTVMAQSAVANADTLTFRLWAKLPPADDVTLAALIAEADETVGTLGTTYSVPDRWILIREDVCTADTVGSGNPGWAVTDAGSGYKAIKVTCTANTPETSLFISVFAATLTNK